MVINAKCMYLGSRDGKTKDGDVYYQIKLLDKSSNDSLILYVNDLTKYKDYKLYNDYDFSFELYKDSKNLYRLKVL